MRFITSVFLLAAAALSAALPVEVDAPVEKRAPAEKRGVDYIHPFQVVRTYEGSPNEAFGPSDYGQTSRVRGGLTGVNSLIAFQLDPSDGGATCNLRFHTPFLALGSKTFQLFEFVPNNGDTFNVNTVTWNSKGGYRNQQLTTYTYTTDGSLVYSFTCPSGGKKLNYEFVSANGDNNLTWNWVEGEGPYIEVVHHSAKRDDDNGGNDDELAKRGPVSIPLAAQTLLREQTPNTPIGPVSSGRVSQSGSGKIVTTLIGFVMPSQNLRGRTCVLRFSKPATYTGSKQFRLYEFIPNGGRTTFDPSVATFNFRTGYRNRDLGVSTVSGSSSFTVYKFNCPAPKTGVNFDVTPTNGDVSITWDNWKGGFTLTAL